MCLIVDRPPGAEVPEEYLENGLDDNQDGWGIVQSDGARLHVSRGLHRAGFWSAWGDVAPDAHVSIHLRYATHGSKDLGNTHPFLFGRDGGYALLHNGMVQVPITRPDRSDTWHFARQVLKPLFAEYPDQFGAPRVNETLEGLIGLGNKMLLIRADGERVFLNRAAGIERDGVWYSNTACFYSSNYGRWKWSRTKGWYKADDDTDEWLIRESARACAWPDDDWMREAPRTLASRTMLATREEIANVASTSFPRRYRL